MRKKEVIENLEYALNAAMMSGAFFKSEKITEQIKEATRLYRETWIIHPLKLALEELKRE